MSSRILVLWSIAVLVFVGANLGCSTDRDPSTLFGPDESGILVVDATLIVGQPLGSIILTRTQRADQFFNIATAVERDARIMVIRHQDQSRDTTNYVPSSLSGLYVPGLSPTTAPIVQPDTRYDLYVETSKGEVMTATTTTPPPFDVDDWVILDEETLEVQQSLEDYGTAGNEVYDRNQVIYAEGLIEAQFQRPDVPAFQVGIFSLDLESDFVIDPDFFDEEDFEELDRIESSPTIAAEDGRLRLPWFAIYFAGRYKLKLFALDENWYDLTRSTPRLGDGAPGFGGNAGDDFERPIFHVNGGIGLFGSASVDSSGFFVLPRE